MRIRDARCPECSHRVKLGAHPRQGQRFVCPWCEISLTLTSLHPVELDLTMLESHVLSSKKKPHMVEVPCPECEVLLKINPHFHQGYRLECSSCDTILEIVSANPLDIDVALPAKLKFPQRDTFNDERRSNRKARKTRK